MAVQTTYWSAIIYQKGYTIMNTQLPNDPVMLLSFVNTQLRDQHISFHDFCKSYMVDEDEICQKLEAIDYIYDLNRNQFI